MKALVLTAITLYLAYAAILVWQHPRFIYPFQPDDVILPGFSRIQLTGDDRTPVFLQELPGEGPIILYFMGNAGALTLFDVAFDRHRAARRHIIALEYRGGAGRPGTPSETRLKADALLVADHALATGKPVIVQGFSHGTGLATHVAARREVAAVILTAPFDRLCRLMAAASWVPACWLPVQRWNSLTDARKTSAPTLVLHGRRDQLIPSRYSESFSNLQNVQRILIEGAVHNDVGSYPHSQNAIEDLVARLPVR